MEHAFLIALEVISIHLYNAYLRYLPFSRRLTVQKKQQLLCLCILLCIPELLLDAALLSHLGISIYSYKLLYTFGWLPFFAVTYYIAGTRLLHHIFIFGMQMMTFYFLHAISNNLLPLLPPADGAVQLIEQQAGLYLAAAILLLPLLRRLFLRLLPSVQIINQHQYGYYIAFLPLVIGLSFVTITLDNEFHMGQALTSRIFLFICFLLLARYIALENIENAAQQAAEKNQQHLTEQLHRLQDYTLLMQESQQQMAVLRHDMRHHIRILYTLTAEKHTDEVLRLLHDLDTHLKQTAVHPIAENPIINAALSVYGHQAQECGIPLHYKINLPKKLTMDEAELAFLLSNLLENAIQAAKKLPSPKPIECTIQTKGSQLVLVIENSAAEPLLFGADGLPYTTAAGHGTGMISLAHFVQKHQACLDFSQENGRVRLMMYWHQPPQ